MMSGMSRARSKTSTLTSASTCRNSVGMAVNARTRAMTGTRTRGISPGERCLQTFERMTTRHSTWDSTDDTRYISATEWIMREWNADAYHRVSNPQFDWGVV